MIDGDTLDLANGTRIRVFGIDTPERGERCYSEATERLRQLAGDSVRLKDGPRPQRGRSTRSAGAVCPLANQSLRQATLVVTGDDLVSQLLVAADGRDVVGPHV